MASMCSLQRVMWYNLALQLGKPGGAVNTPGVAPEHGRFVMHPQSTSKPITKHCPRCGEDKPLTDFRADARRKDGRAYYCIPCKSDVDRDYYRGHAEAVKFRVGQYYAAHRDAIATDLAERRRGDPEWRAKKAASEKRWRERHRDRARETNRRWYANGGLAKTRIAYVTRLYGITIEAYTDLLAEQGGVCAICHQPETTLTRRGFPRAMHVDHDHTTGAVRGLLCARCNAGIGMFGDDPARLGTAIEYLKSHKER